MYRLASIGTARALSARMTRPNTWAALLLSLTVLGCGRDAEAPESRMNDDDNQGAERGVIAVDPGAQRRDPVREAIAVLHGTDLAPKAHGVVRFQAQGPETVKVIADVEGLPPGPHAYHLHVYGDCSSPDAESAGTHFNLHGSSLDPPKDIKRITGNLGELIADESGRAHAESTIHGITMQGGYTILGRSVLVHVKGNDPSQPPIGGAGARMACGVVGVAETKA